MSPWQVPKEQKWESQKNKTARSLEFVCLFVLLVNIYVPLATH